MSSAYSASEWFDFYGPGYAADSRKTMALDLATARLPAIQWGEMWTPAVALLALHILAVSPETASGSSSSGGAVAGPVTSRTAGGLSESYGSSSSTVAGLTAADADLMRSTYGQQYLAMRATRAAGRARVVVPGY